MRVSTVISLLIVLGADIYILSTYYSLVPVILVILFSIPPFIMMRHGIEWVKGRYDAFDPLGFLGLSSVVYFLVSPATQLARDFWPFIPSMNNDLAYVYIWACVNIFGVYLFSVFLKSPARIADEHAASRVPKFIKVNEKTFWRVSLPILAFCGLMQLYVFSKFGGISGFINTYSERQMYGYGLSDRDPFDDLGMTLLFAESFKYVFAMCAVKYFQNKRIAQSTYFLLIFVVVMFSVFLIFGGLRGSRSSTVFSVVFAIAMYHYMIRRISIKFIVVGMLSGAVFLNVYYWYKIAGVDGLSAAFDSELRQNYSASRQDSSLYLLVRDFGRMDIQSLAFKRYDEGKIDHAFGLTYAVSVFSVVPTVLVPQKPIVMNKAKADIVRGVGYYSPDKPRATTIVAGMVGEGFINFGYIGSVLSFLVLALVTNKIRGWIYGLQPGDARFFILPGLWILPWDLVMTDSAVIVMHLFRNLLIPTIIVLLCCRVERASVTSPDSGLLAGVAGRTR